METPFIGQIVLYAFDFAPPLWAPCTGQPLYIKDNHPLFALLGTKFGGDGVTAYKLPDYRAAAPKGTQYCVALQGEIPRPDVASWAAIGEIALLPLISVPSTWAACNGQLLPVAQYRDLFKLIGTTFGGDGVTTFATPNLTQLAPDGSAYYIATRGFRGAVSHQFVGQIARVSVDGRSEWMGGLRRADDAAHVESADDGVHVE